LDIVEACFFIEKCISQNWEIFFAENSQFALKKKKFPIFSQNNFTKKIKILHSKNSLLWIDALSH
jgi:hypothetical protein